MQLSLVEYMLPMKPLEIKMFWRGPGAGASKLATLIWLRNRVIVLTIFAVGMFITILVIHGPWWILGTVLVGIVLGLRQILSLTLRSRSSL